MAAIFRLSSLAALTAAALAPLFVFLTGQTPEAKLWLALFMAVLIFIRHHENIRRLLKGEEPRIGGRSSGPAPRQSHSVSRADPAERLAWLRLARTESVGPVAFQPLIGRYRLGRGGRWRRCPTWPGAPAARAAAHLLAGRRPTPRLDAGEAMGAQLLCALRGRLPGGADGDRSAAAGDLGAGRRRRCCSGRAVAIVGARVASAAGCRFARGLAGELGAAGLVDRLGPGPRRRRAPPTRARCRPARSRCWAAASATSIRPRTRRSTGQIAERGCIVSESAPRRRAQAKDFPRRNRLISGPVAGRGGGRGRAEVRLADHRAAGRRTGPRGAGGAGLAARSPGPRLQRPDPPGRGGLRRRRGRAARHRDARAASAPRPPRPCAGDRTRPRRSCSSASSTCSRRRRSTSTSSPASSARRPARCSPRWSSCRWPAGPSCRGGMAARA